MKRRAVGRRGIRTLGLLPARDLADRGVVGNGVERGPAATEEGLPIRTELMINVADSGPVVTPI